MKLDKATFTHRNLLNLFIVYELDTWARHLTTQFTPGECLFGAVKTAKNSHPNKYGYIDPGIRFDERSQLLLLNDKWVKNFSCRQ